MRKALQLLALLADGQKHAGADLATSLGGSRAAIWNQVQRLREVGIEVEADRTHGYRLTHPFEPLSEDALNAEFLSASERRLTATVVPVIDSTNGSLIEASTQRDVHGDVLLAEYQSAGRGRRGDRWQSPPGSGLWFSLGWRFAAPPSTFSALGLIVGLSLARTLRAAGVGGVELKWPNDLVCGGRKLGGILIEMRAEAGGPATVVIGIGINYRLGATVAESIDRPVTDLTSEGAGESGRNALAANLVLRLSHDLDRFDIDGFGPFQVEWPHFDALSNRAVRLELGDRIEAGIVRGVDDYGALKLEQGGTINTYLSGHLLPA